MTGRRVAYLNARLLDPDSGLDATGALLVEDDRIVDVGPQLFREGAPSVAEVVDCRGLSLAPGLIDIRVRTCEPGAEHKESIASAGHAAAAGGVTTIVALPDTEPVIDDVPVVEFVTRRGQEAGMVRVHCYGSITRGFKAPAINGIAPFNTLKAETVTAYELGLTSLIHRAAA